MKPIAVLLLVIVAIAALIFGLFTLGQKNDTPTVVEPSTTQPGPKTPTHDEHLAVEPANGGRQTPAVGTKPEGPREQGNPADFVYANELTGTVQDPKGKPLANVEVLLTTVSTGGLFFVDDPHDRSKDVPGKTDKAGRFSFRNLAPRASYTLVCSHPDFSRKEIQTIPVDQEGVYEEPPITLNEGAQLKGYVKDEQGNPVPGAELSLDGMLYAASPEAAPDRMKRTTNAEGWYAFTNVAKGQRTMAINAKGFGKLSVNNLAFEKDEQITRDVILKTAEMIRGRVIAAGNVGIPKARVMALGITNTAQTGRAEVLTDEKGEFLFEDLAPGEYNVIANAKGYRFERALRVKTNTADVVIEGLKEASVCGKVLDGASGQPMTSFTCRMRFSYGPGVATAPTQMQTNFNDANGEFCLEGVPQGEYVVEAWAPGYAPSFSNQVQIVPSKSVAGVTIRLNRGGSIRGRIVASDGKPIGKARVITRPNDWTDDEFTQTLANEYPSNTTSAEVRTADDGTFVMLNLSPDSYQLQIQAAGFTSQVRHDVNVPDNGEANIGDVKITHGGTLRGTLYDPAGKGIVGGAIHMRPTDNTSVYTYTTKSGMDGKFVIQNIVAGRYYVSGARASGEEVNPFESIQDRQSSQKSVVISDEQETKQDLSIPQ